MAEELDMTSIALLTLAALAFILLIKLMYKLRMAIEKTEHELDQKVLKATKDTGDLRREVELLYAETNEKIDYEYLNKRVDGLIALLKKESKG